MSKHTYWILICEDGYFLSIGKWSEIEVSMWANDRISRIGQQFVCPVPDIRTGRQAVQWLNSQFN
jgi:hypothetical protein